VGVVRTNQLNFRKEEITLNSRNLKSPKFIDSLKSLRNQSLQLGVTELVHTIAPPEMVASNRNLQTFLGVRFSRVNMFVSGRVTDGAMVVNLWGSRVFLRPG